MGLESIIDIGGGDMIGDTFARAAYMFNLFLVIAVVAVIVAICAWLVYTFIIKYKWRVLVRVQREGGSHYWVPDRGGNFRSPKTGLQSFRLRKHRVDLPPIPAKSIEPMAKGKSLVFLHKHDTGTYDYLPFIPTPTEDGLKQQTFDIDMQNWARTKIKADLDKFKFRDFMERYQIVISVGLIVIVLVVGLYGLYKIQANVAGSMSALAKELIEAKNIACPTQVIPGI